MAHPPNPHDSVALMIPRHVAQHLAASVGHNTNSAHEQLRSWPGSTGAGPPGMAGEAPSVQEPGGNLEKQLLPPAVTSQEALWNIIPDESWFSPTISPERPAVAEIGAYQVPRAQAYWLMDYEFQVFVQSGIDANDTLPAANGRFFGLLGFDLTINATRLASVSYELDPHPAPVTRSAFAPAGAGGGGGRGVPNQATFSSAAYNQFAAATGAGLSLLPAWRKIFGPRQGPFTVVANEQQVIALSVAIFRPLPAPIASITGRIAGFRMAKTVSDTLVNRLRVR
jgi:hypothetical protein